MPQVEIVPYRAEWVEEFRAIGAALRSALGGMALRIDHIGSTSVPGLAAKDRIDIQVTVPTLDPVDPLVAAFDAAGGYLLREGIHSDHRPPGDTHPEVHWRKRYFGIPEGGRPTNLHVRVDGHANQRYALLFRDYLRVDSLACGGYERAKMELARYHPEDLEAYVTIKDPICDIVMAGAEVWATTTGWMPGPSDA